MPAQAAPSSENLLLGKGQLWAKRFDTNGVGHAFLHLGNVETFEDTTADDNVDKFSSMSAGAPLYKRVNRRRTVTFKLVLSEYNPENMALLTMGSQSTLVQAATAVTGEALNATTIPGAYYRTAKLGPISAVVVKFGATTGVLGTDYAITNAAVGMIRILPGTILTGAVTIDYTPTAYTSPTGPQVVHGGDSGIVQAELLFIGDPTTGPKMMVNIWKASLTPDGAIGFISDDFANAGLSAAILDDSANHASSPLYEITYLP